VTEFVLFLPRLSLGSSLRMLRKAMVLGQGSKTKAAMLLGMRRGTLRQKLRELGILP